MAVGRGVNVKVGTVRGWVGERFVLVGRASILVGMIVNVDDGCVLVEYAVGGDVVSDGAVGAVQAVSKITIKRYL